MELVRLDRLTFMDLLCPLDSLLSGADNWLDPAVVATPVMKRTTIDFNRAYVELGPAVRRIGIYRGKMAPSDMDDFVHEVFERVWQKRDHFRGDSTAKAWIIGIAYNVARNKAKLFKPRVDAGLDCDTLPSHARLSPEERAMRGEAEAQLTLAVARLTEYEQWLFVTGMGVDFQKSDTARLCEIEYNKTSRDLDAACAKVAKILAQLQRENGWRKR
jgi:RNA polymerase sigma factor (sigma-70 family)